MRRRSWLSGKNCAVLILLVLALLVPGIIVTNKLYLHLIIMSYIWAMLASSLNICMGYTGLVSIVHGSFFGIGAYGVALMVVKGGLNYWLALPASLGLVVLFSLAIGLLALRTRGPYFVIFSLCVCLSVTIIIEHWDSFTEGPRGLVAIPPINSICIPGGLEIQFTSMLSQYYLILGCFLFTILTKKLVINSRFGRSFEAVRLNEVLADSLGINVMVTKIFSFAFSAFFAGLAGALYSPYMTYLNPSDSSFWLSFDAILYTIVGGAGTLGGPVIGAFALTIIPELLRFLQQFRLLFYAIVLILTVIFLPKGLISLPRLISERVVTVNKKNTIKDF